MAEDPTPRQLLKQLQGSIFSATGEAGSLPLSAASATEGWEAVVVAPAGGKVSYFIRTYIDLAGYTQDELTTFVQGVDIQKSQPPSFATNVTEVIEIDLITSRRLSSSEVSINLLAGTIPGFLGDTLNSPGVDLQEVIYGEQRTYTPPNPATGAFITTNRETWGSGNPSAADRLHWTRIYYVSMGGTSSMSVFPSNLVVQAITAREKDLVWIERLRRAYTQQRSEP